LTVTEGSPNITCLVFGPGVGQAALGESSGEVWLNR
jgi:hypothetical protein